MVVLVDAPDKLGKTKTSLTDCFLPKKPKLSYYFVYTNKNHFPAIGKMVFTKGTNVPNFHTAY